MSDRMTPIPFDQLVNWITTEKKRFGTVFDARKPYIAHDNKYEIFGRKLETVIGPAAGPHTQLAQNIAAAYYTGSRFFELKTVQKIDGEDLPVSKPCIKADDEGYNVEWSTELYVPQAKDEYIKAYFLLKLMAKEFGLGSMDGFQFNMSVGYDLEGIKLPKVDSFINTMKDASEDVTFNNCKAYLKWHIGEFEHFNLEDLEEISPNICNSVTLSTLHGCPPAEIERIARYLITEKDLNTFIKCNPTLLGYEFARSTMDKMGYDYIAFGDFHFKDDLQWEDAVPMLERLMELSKSRGREFGVKITNTFPVDIKAGELPGSEMYMSGKSLYPLSINLAARLTKQFDGKLRISYSGGADYYNIKAVVDAGIWPVTMATTMLKPGGYERLIQIAEELEGTDPEFKGVSVEKTAAIAEAAIKDIRHIKSIKPDPSRKIEDKVPLVDCFTAPCREGCPIHQDITKYMQLAEEGRYKEAMEVIADKNPLPWITGILCAHNCMSKCTRNFYESPVHIRDMKLISAKGGYEEFMKELKSAPISSNKKVAVIGGGPAGLAAAYFTRRAGFATTVFEKEESLGGVVRHVIPSFRISAEDIEKDAALVRAMGVEIKTGSEIKSVSGLKELGYDYVIIAIGAGMPGIIKLEGDEPLDAIDFLKEFKETEGKLKLGKTVAVIGAGNTAMDVARAAIRNEGVEKVYLVYRRTRRYMPADEEELREAIEDGVDFKELLAPISFKNGRLECELMELGEPEPNGRRGVKGTGSRTELQVDTVIAAVGERVDTDFYLGNGINVDDRGRALVNAESFESSLPGVYIVGDGCKGPATVVEGIRDGMKAAEAIAARTLTKTIYPEPDTEHIRKIKGVLSDQSGEKDEANRCLNCAVICESCVDVCPNRANTTIKVPGMDMPQIIHVDYMCNECGNCKSFCPYDSAPYRDKFTLFANESDFENSINQGFAVLDRETELVRVRYLGNVRDIKLSEAENIIESGLIKTMRAVMNSYDFMLMQ